MKKEHAPYIAGIIDGEGSISLVKIHKNNHPSPFISIASSDYELLEWVKNVTGSGSITRKKNYNPLKHKNSYCLNIRYNQAIELLEHIVDYIVIPRKKKRAQLIINKYKKLTPRNGRYSEDLLIQKEVFYKEFMSI